MQEKLPLDDVQPHMTRLIEPIFEIHITKPISNHLLEIINQPTSTKRTAKTSTQIIDH